jgi:hypothetical protein
LGGSGGEYGIGIALDSADNAYVTGETNSTDFPVTPGAFQSANGGVAMNCARGGADAFLTKINPRGSALVYSTYLGGSCSDGGQGIAVDSAGNAYVAGNTFSTNFPTTLGAFQPACASAVHCAKGFGFVTEFNPTGSGLVYSTYLGSFVPGKCSNCFPYNSANWVAVDRLGSIYVTGITESPGFPTLNAPQPNIAGGYDAFVAKFMYTASTTGLVSSPNPSVSGKPVTFTATVSPVSGGTPTGKVSFRDGATLLANTLLSGSTATFTTRNLPVGLNGITAVYGGDSNFSSSTSAPLNQYVLAATTTTLTSSPNPSIKAQSVTFTAVVSSGSGAPPNGETVSFMKGTIVLGTAALSSGTAIFTTSSLPVGTDSITAVYGGDANLAPSKSNIVKQVVNKAAE